jgi:hypothetical protein
VREFVFGTALVALSGCGSTGKAQPAEVEISWPDAAVFGASTKVQVGLQDAGDAPQPVATTDAQAGPERVR